jgi:hypothetical protein
MMAALLLAGLCSSAMAYSKGDWVLGQWRGGAMWFPGVVESHKGNMVTVQYDDGTRETRPENQVKPYDWRVGTRVECNFKNSGKWFSGRITRLNNENLSVAYDDGDKENTKTGACRSR